MHLLLSTWKPYSLAISSLLIVCSPSHWWTNQNELVTSANVHYDSLHRPGGNPVSNPLSQSHMRIRIGTVPKKNDDVFGFTLGSCVQYVVCVGWETSDWPCKEGHRKADCTSGQSAISNDGTDPLGRIQLPNEETNTRWKSKLPPY